MNVNSYKEGEIPTEVSIPIPLDTERGAAMGGETSPPHGELRADQPPLADLSVHFFLRETAVPQQNAEPRRVRASLAVPETINMTTAIEFVTALLNIIAALVG